MDEYLDDIDPTEEEEDDGRDDRYTNDNDGDVTLGEQLMTVSDQLDTLVSEVNRFLDAVEEAWADGGVDDDLMDHARELRQGMR